MRLEGGFKRGGRIRVAECLRQSVPDRWASIKKKDLSPNVFVFTRGVTKVRVSEADCNLSCWSIRLKEIGQILRGCSRDGIEWNGPFS